MPISRGDGLQKEKLSRNSLIPTLHFYAGTGNSFRTARWCEEFAQGLGFARRSARSAAGAVPGRGWSVGTIPRQPVNAPGHLACVMATERVPARLNPFGELCLAERRSVHIQPALLQATDLLARNYARRTLCMRSTTPGPVESGRAGHFGSFWSCASNSSKAKPSAMTRWSAPVRISQGSAGTVEAHFDFSDFSVIRPTGNVT